MTHAKSIISRPVAVIATPATSEAQQFRTAYQMRLIFLRRHVALRNKLMFTAFSAHVLLNSYLTITNGPRASDRIHVRLENDLQMHQDRTQLVSHCVVITFAIACDRGRRTLISEDAACSPGILLHNY